MEDSGKLELTWTNKLLRAARRRERRIHVGAAVRLPSLRGAALHDVESVGDTCDDRSRAKDNLLRRLGAGPPSSPSIDGTHWVVEPKADRELATHAVHGKELAAKRWANHVSAQTGTDWRYLLVGEIDVAEARGSWAALKQLSR